MIKKVSKKNAVKENKATIVESSNTTAHVLGDAKIAVVDVQFLVNQTPSVLALRAEQQQNASIIQNWINGVNSQLSQIADQNTRNATAQQYQIELNKRQQMLQSQYAMKIQAIDAELSKLISDVANEKKLDYVFAKGMVVFGGTDITEDVAKLLKK
ncbi:MAG: OmpH family outer membrane protein [Alphaproteobacteria bacterium]|nr:OmpH family outer membrane protein [Alphaproteobacteria bacterium]